MVWIPSSVEMEKGEEEVKSRRKKRSLGSKFRKNREKWCEEGSNSEESEEDLGSGKYKRNDKNCRKKITSGKRTKKESLVKMIKSMKEVRKVTRTKWKLTKVKIK